MALTDNITSYWKFDESSGDAADSVGSFTGTNTSVTYSNTAPAVIGNYAVFNGSSCFTLSSGVVPASGDFSFQFWFYGNNASGQIFCDWSLSKRNIYIQANANKIEFYRGDGGTSQSASPVITATLSNNTWYHIVVTQSGTTGSIYVDAGTPVTSNVTYTGGASTSQTNYFAVYNNGSFTNYLTGRLDESGVWSRALSSLEITQLYNSGSGLQYPFTGTLNNLKTLDGIAKANIKTIDGIAIANVKTYNGIA